MLGQAISWARIPDGILSSDMTDNSRYVANLTKGSLKVAESRVIAGLLLEGLSVSEVKAVAVKGNLLQKRSPEATRTLASHLAWRLASVPSCLLQLVFQGSNREATQACLACLTMRSPLFSDYLKDSVSEVRAQRRSHLAPADWSSYLDVLESRDPSVRAWTSPVRAKLRQNIWRILAEAEIVNSTKHLRLQSVRLEESVKKCLTDSTLSPILNTLAAGGVL